MEKEANNNASILRASKSKLLTDLDKITRDYSNTVIQLKDAEARLRKRGIVHGYTADEHLQDAITRSNYYRDRVIKADNIVKEFRELDQKIHKLSIIDPFFVKDFLDRLEALPD